MREMGIVGGVMKNGMILIRCSAGNALGYDAVADGIEFGRSGFGQVVVGCLAVDGVNHHTLGTDTAEGFQPRSDKGLGGIVEVALGIMTFKKHGLDDDMPLKPRQVVDDALHIVAGRNGPVKPSDVIGVDGVKFLDIVVNAHQCIMHLWAVNHRGIAQHRHFGLREIAVAQRQCVIDDASEVGMSRGFTISGKGQHVRSGTIFAHVYKAQFQGLTHFFTGRKFPHRPMVAVESALTIQAIEGAHLAIAWQQVDTK